MNSSRHSARIQALSACKAIVGAGVRTRTSHVAGRKVGGIKTGTVECAPFAKRRDLDRDEIWKQLVKFFLECGIAVKLEDLRGGPQWWYDRYFVDSETDKEFSLSGLAKSRKPVDNAMDREAVLASTVDVSCLWICHMCSSHGRKCDLIFAVVSQLPVVAVPRRDGANNALHVGEVLGIGKFVIEVSDGVATTRREVEVAVVNFYEYATKPALNGQHPSVPSCWYVCRGNSVGVVAPTELVRRVLLVPDVSEADTGRPPLPTKLNALSARPRYFCVKPLL